MNNNFKGDDLYFGDAIELYKEALRPKSVDLICTDLPYGATNCKWDTIIPFDKLWEMVDYLLRPNGTFITTAQQPFTSALIMSNVKMFKYNWHWNKVKPSSFFNAKNAPMKKIEDICVFSYASIANGSKTPMKYNPQGLIDCGKIRPPKNDSVPNQSTIGKRPSRANAYKQEFTNYPTDLIEFSFEQKPIHATQKPISLVEFLIKTYSDEWDFILDPFAGSATTLIAAKNTNRYFMGFEKDEEIYKRAKNRLDEHIKYKQV